MGTTISFLSSKSGEKAQTFNVLAFDFDISKAFNDRVGIIDARDNFSDIMVRVIADEDINLSLFDSYINNIPLSGYITVDNSQNSIYDNEPDVRVIKFEEACIFSLNDNYNIEDKSQRTLNIRLASKKVIVDDVEFVSQEESINI